MSDAKFIIFFTPVLMVFCLTECYHQYKSLGRSILNTDSLLSFESTPKSYVLYPLKLNLLFSANITQFQATISTFLNNYMTFLRVFFNEC